MEEGWDKRMSKKPKRSSAKEGLEEISSVEKGVWVEKEERGSYCV